MLFCLSTSLSWDDYCDYVCLFHLGSTLEASAHQVKKPVDAGVKEALRALRAAALSEPGGPDGAMAVKMPTIFFTKKKHSPIIIDSRKNMGISAISAKSLEIGTCSAAGLAPCLTSLADILLTWVD